MSLKTENKILIVIAGPTASGKTDFAIKLAEKFNAEIISADSRQVYNEMNIGTAKPDVDDLNRVAHHFIGNVLISEKYNVGIYEKEVISFLDEYYKNKDIAILCGGTGLYIEAVLNGLDHFPDIDIEVLDKIEYDLKNKGLNFLQKELKIADPEYFNKVDIYNSHRLIRALSVIRQTGQLFSGFLEKNNSAREFQSIELLIDPPRSILYERINKRVDLMINNGLEQEARTLYDQRKCKALQTVGYRELFGYFDGSISRDDAIELIKRNTRRYAKRQVTWFRNRGEWTEVDPENFESVLSLIYQKINQIEKRYS